MIKGRTCADGSKQKRYISKEETSSPTVALESLLLTFCIDAFENRDVAIFDVPGAYLNADLPEDKFIIIKFENKFVDIMCTVNPELKKEVIHDGKNKVLYLKIVKALYGCVESALLWYQLFSSELTKIGFTINDYDKCVANKMIDGKQCTITWYVDDVKVSHEDSEVVSNIIQILESKFGTLKTTRGKKHTYLGMKIELMANNKFPLI